MLRKEAINEEEKEKKKKTVEKCSKFMGFTTGPEDANSFKQVLRTPGQLTVMSN